MFRNYLRTALNNLLKNRLFSFINIGGLAIGLAACIMIGLYVRDETSYDQQWSDADRIYRLNTSIDSGSGMRKTPATAALVLDALEREFPEIENGVRLMSFERQVEFGDRHFEESVIAVDPQLTEIFDFEVLAGDLPATLRDPASIALEESFSALIFAGETALGSILEVSLNGVVRSYRVGAVYRLPPGNTVMDLPALVPLDETTLPPIMLRWQNPFFTTFLRLTEDADLASLSNSLPAFIERNVDLASMSVPREQVNQHYALDLQPITDLHLDSPFDTTHAGGNRTVVLAFSAISLLVLLIGCINFTILSTARATRRARDVAMRKVVGASRPQLVLQYLGESLVIVALAMILALVLVELLLPVFSGIVGMGLNLQYSEARTWLSLFMLLLVVGIAGGLYPACVLSRYRPASTLKASRSAEAQGAARLRASLVVFQFAVSIALMIATAVIYAQVSYTVNRDPGFDRNDVLVIDNLNLRADVLVRLDALKEEVGKLSGVTNVTISSSQPMQKTRYAMNFSRYRLPGETGESTGIATLTIDADFFTTYRIALRAGRDYAAGREKTSLIYAEAAVRQGRSENVIVNESTVRAMGFASAEAAVGRELESNGLRLNIIGVVADTHFLSMNAAPRPEVYVYSTQLADALSVRFEGNPQTLLAGITQTWERVIGDAELSTSFVAQNMEQEFARERREATMLVSFALLAISIACLGLFGSAAYAVERRTREIGIRKAMGAEVKEIVRMLVLQFSRPVMLANVIAWPLALWVMLNWLQRFPYQMGTWTLVPICLGAGLLAVAIAGTTIFANTLRAARAHPVVALRYE